jgi:glycosyltransferase involved in cell wall biosynthesis
MIDRRRERLRAVVVVPARDEQERIGACLLALAGQRGVSPGSFEVILVLDGCRDETRERALEVAATRPELMLTITSSETPGVGHARRAGMDAACRRLLDADMPGGLIATTDADSRVAPDWLAVQLALAADGARAIGGRIELDAHEAALLPAAALETRTDRALERLASVASHHHECVGNRDGDGQCAHHQFSGASLALTAQTYRDIGGMPPLDALEDEALQRGLEDHRIPIVRCERVRVTTSARTDGRAPRGLARDLALDDWRARRTLSAVDFDARALVDLKSGGISVVLPAREVAGTIARIIEEIRPLRELGLVDEILVIDAASRDGTAAVAAASDALVLQEDELLTNHGPARGKGDAMWRALSVARGEIVVFLDADTRNFSSSFVLGLLGPILTDNTIRFVKGAFRRPLDLGGQVLAGEGGRVTELVARPLLNIYAPHLAGFDQPLAGEVAAYTDDLRQLRFPAGYGVEIANLIDMARLAGTDALAQVDLGERQNRHQSLRDLSAMAYAVIVAAASRIPDGGLPTSPALGPLILPPMTAGGATETRPVVVFERPPISSLASTGPNGIPAVAA